MVQTSLKKEIQKRMDQARFHQKMSHNTLSSVCLTADDEERLLGMALLVHQLKDACFLRHPLYPLSFFVDKTVDPVSVYRFVMGAYDVSLLKALSDALSQNNTVLHIGAGFGVSSVLSGMLTRNPVFSVEPCSFLHPIIQQNAVLNAVSVFVELGCLSPGEKGGKTDFFITDDLYSSSLFLKEKPTVQTVQVPVLSLSALLKKHKVDTLVLDAPGVSLCLLNSAESLKKLQNIIVQFYPLDEEDAQLKEKVITFLKPLGLFVSNIIENTIVFKRY